jgi:hypothetical protein
MKNNDMPDRINLALNLIKLLWDAIKEIIFIYASHLFMYIILLIKYLISWNVSFKNYVRKIFY